jgi:hypothetical protein
VCFIRTNRNLEWLRNVTVEKKGQLGRAMAQAVSRRPLIAAARVRARVNPVGFVVDKVALGHISEN